MRPSNPSGHALSDLHNFKLCRLSISNEQGPTAKSSRLMFSIAHVVHATCTTGLLKG
jgi:hypothetical protein